MGSVRVRGALRGQSADDFALLDHFVDGESFFGKSAGGAGLDTFAARGAVAGFAPVVFEVADDARVDTARGDLPDVGSLDLGADAHAARAENAAVVIEDEAGMGHVDL